MYSQDSDSPGTGESQYQSSGSQYPATGGQPSQGQRGPPSPQIWAGAHHPLQQPYVGRSPSAFGDYRPQMDAVNNPGFDSTNPFAGSPVTQSDFDAFSLEQMGIYPYTVPNQPSAPIARPVASSAQRRGGGRTRGGRASSSSGTIGRGSSSSGAVGRGERYSDEESVALSKAWISVSEDPRVGTDQDAPGFWLRVLSAYNHFKPRDAPERGDDQLRKKWGRTSKAVNLFAGIHENNLAAQPSGTNEDDIKLMSLSMFSNMGKTAKFMHWEDYQILRHSPKWEELRVEIAQKEGGSKRIRVGASGEYSSSSAGDPSEDVGAEVADEPGPTFTRRARPMGQQRAQREARAGSSLGNVSRAGSSDAGTSIPPRSRRASDTLAGNIDCQREKNLIDAIKELRAETDPELKKVLRKMIRRLESQLGMSDDDVDAAPGGAQGSDAAETRDGTE